MRFGQSERKVVQALRHFGGSGYAHMLMEHAGIDQGRCYKAINNLEALGYVSHVWEPGKVRYVLVRDYAAARVPA